MSDSDFSEDLFASSSPKKNQDVKSNSSALLNKSEDGGSDADLFDNDDNENQSVANSKNLVIKVSSELSKLLVNGKRKELSALEKKDRESKRQKKAEVIRDAKFNCFSHFLKILAFHKFQQSEETKATMVSLLPFSYNFEHQPKSIIGYLKNITAQFIELFGENYSEDVKPRVSVDDNLYKRIER